MLRGAVDVAFVRMPVAEAGLALIPLGSEGLVAALPTGHRLAGAVELLKRGPGRGAAAAAGRGRAYRSGAASLVQAASGAGPVEEELELVARGRGLTLLPRSAAAFYTRPGIHYVPVLDVPPREICLAHAATDRSELTRSFVRAAEATGWPGARRPALT
ncbi:LysR substrate-binding domain-containing protein [Streptomyces sp. S1D4-11]